MHDNFKKYIIVFWALWWLIALWTDVVGGLAHLKLLNTSWALDNNYTFLVKSLEMYQVNSVIPIILYITITLCSAISCLLFIFALFRFHTEKWIQVSNFAFIFSLCYWMLFFLADQLIMNFSLEENHMTQGGFELLCYIVINSRQIKNLS